MNICEAANKALKEGKCIREKPFNVKVKLVKSDVGVLMKLDGNHPVRGSLLMIHNAWTYANGNATELRKAAEDLDKITQASVNAYVSRATISEDVINVHQTSTASV